MRYSPALLLVVLLAMLSGCTDTADTFPMNAAAKGMGPLRASFVRTGVGRGPITFTMADGEILTGEYRVAFGTSTAMAFSGGRSATAMVISDGPVQFVATLTRRYTYDLGRPFDLAAVPAPQRHPERSRLLRHPCAL